jgi:hypothetical protein
VGSVSKTRDVDRERRSSLVLGLLLILGGAGFLVARAAGIRIEDVGWPLYVILPGIGLIVAALVIRGPASIGLGIAGSVTTATGLILAVQDATGLYETWAYAWALIAPTSIGVGLVIGGFSTGDRELLANGARTIGVGLVMFLAFAFFFEGIIGLSGARIPGLDTFLPLVLIVVGIGVVAYGLIRSRGGT